MFLIIFPMFSLTQVLFSTMLFNLKLFGDFSAIFVLLLSSVILYDFYPFKFKVFFMAHNVVCLGECCM